MLFLDTVHLLANPNAAAGRGSGAGQAVATAIAARNRHVVHLRPDGVAGIVPALEQAHRDGMSHLVVAGGDGLVHHCLPALAGSAVTVGIVPVGTGNDFARALGLPASLDAAVATALEPPRPVDLLTTDGGLWAASVITGGFSGAVNARANRLRFPRGSQRYTVATLLELPRLSPVDLVLELDGTAEKHRASLFAIANTRYFGGGMAICPDSRPDDGLLHIAVIGATSRVELARTLPTVFSGRHVDHPAVTIRRGRCVRVHTSAPLWADGEPFTQVGADGTTIQVVPGVLRVAGSLSAD